MKELRIRYHYGTDCLFQSNGLNWTVCLIYMATVDRRYGLHCLQNEGYCNVMFHLCSTRILYCIVSLHLYSASCSAHQSEALPVRETQREESRQTRVE